MIARAPSGICAHGDGDVVDRLRAWIDEMADAREAEPEDPEIRLLRSRAIARDPDLRGAAGRSTSTAPTTRSPRPSPPTPAGRPTPPARR